jgi:glycosyltransferase involved in cell wall biosynthesis
MALVSVIIPTRNRAKVLRRAIESAKCAGQDVEVIVVDDASTDETGAMCRDRSDITYLRMEQNVGVAQARNMGVLRSAGQYLVFLDDDDLRLPGSIDKQLQILSRQDQAGFVYGQVHIGHWQTCVPTGEIRPARCATGYIFWELLRGNFIYLPSVLVRKRHFESVGLFARDVPGTEDWDAWIRLSEIHAVDAVHEPVAIYRDYTRESGQMSSNRPKMCKSCARTLARALRSPRGLAAEPDRRRTVHAEYTNLLWEHLIREGRDALLDRKFQYAALNYVTALQINPLRAARMGAVVNFIQDLLQSTGTKSRQ